MIMPEMTYEVLKRTAASIAKSFSLRPEVICGIIERESSWNPLVEPRFEQGFYEQYVAHMEDVTEEEKHDRSCSWGLMQVMGETAREYGFESSLKLLQEPEVNITYGCKLFRHLLKISNGDEARALLHYNGGNNTKYPDEVLAFATKYAELAQTV